MKLSLNKSAKKQTTVASTIKPIVMCDDVSIVCDKQFVFLRDEKEIAGNWRDCKVLFVGDRYTVFVGNGGKEYSRPSRTVLFRDKALDT
jgi:hypothetical protein